MGRGDATGVHFSMNPDTAKLDQRDRLNINHLLLWTAGTSVALGALNFAYPMELVPASAYVAEAIRRFVGSAAYGAAIAAWLWILWRRRLGRPFELKHPGHFLLVMASAVAVVDLGLVALAREAILLELLSDWEIDDLRMLISYATGLLICGTVFLSGVLRGIWKFAFALMALRCIAYSVLFLAEVLYNFTGIPQANWTIYFYRGLSVTGEASLMGVSFALVIAVIYDWLHRRAKRDWLHYLGIIATLVICINASAGELRYGQLRLMLGPIYDAILRSFNS